MSRATNDPERGEDAAPVQRHYVLDARTLVIMAGRDGRIMLSISPKLTVYSLCAGSRHRGGGFPPLARQ